MGDGAGTLGLEATQAWRLLEMEKPLRTARRVATWVQILAFVALAAGFAWALLREPRGALSAFHAGAALLFTLAVLWRLFAAAARVAQAPIKTKAALTATSLTAAPAYTILCPLYREAGVARALGEALARLDYPREALDIKFVIEADDEETRAAIEALDFLRPFEIVMIAQDGPRTKPKALNIALAVARGTYLAVYDAEDRPHPQQLRAAAAAFAAGDERLACVQAPLLIDNSGASWISGQFAAEYAIQFTQILPFLTALGLPFPLGGSSNHFRVEALKAVRGWDSYNVTEDADLGYRLARKGWRTAMIAPPTWEEAPVRYDAWSRQRTRWIKGHLQTWLVLMRNPIRTAREMGLAGFAAMHLVLGGGVLAAFAHGPMALLLLIAALTPLRLLGPPDFALAAFGYATAIYGGLIGAGAARDGRLIGAALTMPLYWPLSFAPALRAFVELFSRPHYWAKTAHGVSPRRGARSERAIA